MAALPDDDAALASDVVDMPDTESGFMDASRVQATLARIGLPVAPCSLPTPSIEGLRQIQEAFVMAVPFENQTMHEPGMPLTDLSLAGAFVKVVEQRRGGVCYELNPLLRDLLRALGYRVFMTSATMFGPDGKPGDYQGDHVTLVAELEGDLFLLDVGNGLDLGAPVPFSGSCRSRGEVGDEAAEFSVGPYSDADGETRLGSYALYIHDGNETRVRFAFTPVPVERPDIAEAARYIQTSPDSFFTQKRLASMRTQEGRITLSGSQLITSTAAGKITKDVGGLEEQKKILAAVFGLHY